MVHTKAWEPVLGALSSNYATTGGQLRSFGFLRLSVLASWIVNQSFSRFDVCNIYVKPELGLPVNDYL